MKVFLIIPVIMLLASCGPQSSPEGRSKLRDEAIQNQIDSLKSQNKALADSVAHINMILKKIQHQ